MKKRLLNEQTTRKMMGLAGIGSLSEKFIKEAEEVEEGMYAKRNDEEVEEGMHAKRDEMLEQEPGEEKEEDPMGDPMMGEPGMEAGDLEGDAGEPDIDLGAEEPGMEAGDLEGDMGAAEEPAGGGMISIDGLLDALEVALKDALGGKQDVELKRAEEEPAEDELAMAEGDYTDDVMEDLDAAGVELEEDNNLEEDDASLEEDIVNEITRRVARRLLRESAKTKK
tara:strand:- start:429 stop:1100 length:672 start_codon:yes stop_codon:yes gene_type:complete